jgi:hypothetical protein
MRTTAEKTKSKWLSYEKPLFQQFLFYLLITNKTQLRLLRRQKNVLLCEYKQE